jgi:hypothetical protein
VVIEPPDAPLPSNVTLMLPTDWLVDEFELVADEETLFTAEVEKIMIIRTRTQATPIMM